MAATRSGAGRRARAASRARPEGHATVPEERPVRLLTEPRPFSGRMTNRENDDTVIDDLIKNEVLVWSGNLHIHVAFLG
jgi:hypothetical protein